MTRRYALCSPNWCVGPTTGPFSGRNATLESDTLLLLRDGLTRHPLREQIAAGLAAQIEAGLLAPGELLPGERELAALLEVGRESVRSALQALAARGMVEISHGARCRVVGPAPVPFGGRPPRPDYRPEDQPGEVVMEARLALEPLLTARAVPRLDAGARARLRRLVEAQRGMTEDPVRFQIADREFHLLLHRAAGNPVLAAFAEEVYGNAYPMRLDVMRCPGGVLRAWQDHLAILTAIEAGAAEAAGAAMAAHIRSIHGLAAASGG